MNQNLNRFQKIVVHWFNECLINIGVTMATFLLIASVGTLCYVVLRMFVWICTSVVSFLLFGGIIYCVDILDKRSRKTKP